MLKNEIIEHLLQKRVLGPDDLHWLKKDEAHFIPFHLRARLINQARKDNRVVM